MQYCEIAVVSLYIPNPDTDRNRGDPADPRLFLTQLRISASPHDAWIGYLVLAAR